jgi:glycosyltransferase involved in cell wall biosynthesis
VSGQTPGRLPVTVVTVTLNARPALERTADSLRPFAGQIDEFIVIDGASNDGTPHYLASEPLVTRWISEPDTGIYDAMNRGWTLANDANHVLFLGAGDRLLALPRREELAAGTVVFGDVELEGRRRFVSRADYRLLLGNTLHHQALLVPKALHPSPPFDVRHRIYADYDFNLRLYRQGATFRKSPLFAAAATGGGVSDGANMQQMAAVVSGHYGPVMALASRAYLAYQGFRAALRR